MDKKKGFNIKLNKSNEFNVDQIITKLTDKSGKLFTVLLVCAL